MPFYSIDITVPAQQTVEKELEIEGEAVTWFFLRFPPGPAGLLEVSVFYGEKKIWPSEEDQVFKGDNEWIYFQEEWPLPETPCKLRIVAQNKDSAHEHSCLLRLKTRPIKEEKTVKFRVTPEGFVEVAL